MKKIGIIVALVACFLLSACTVLEKKQQAGAVVELNGHYLYRSTLDSLTLGMNSEDSTRVAQQFISQWAKEILVYDKASSRTNQDIERLVENYRRTLYVHAYEQRLVDRRMSKTILDSTVVAVYENQPDRFILDESIIKGLLVIVPNDAPTIDKLRGWLSKVELDKIEKYAYQNASGYELFSDKWLTTTELLRQIPIERAELESRLKTRNQVEITDSTKIYLLQITSKHMRGEAMPIDYARPEIEKMILNARQVEFLNKERERLYNEAIQTKKVKFL
ncbi:MAG: hypothetical protein II901_00690 [Paludibacteraceae bacterium]|nr:hypothetical protein [Paludibacteraceae bacterium]